MMLTTPILLDYQSSTPCLEDVVNSMAPYWSEIFSTPRIGWEVVVDFLEGDPDRPLVTGRVYNSEDIPPFPDRQ